MISGEVGRLKKKKKLFFQSWKKIKYNLEFLKIFDESKLNSHIPEY